MPVPHFAVSPPPGRSQPPSPRWTRVPLSSFFPQISIKFSYFFSNFNSFSSSFWPLRVGESPTREGSGYATGPPGLIIVYFGVEMNVLSQ